jgi:hypothetical protein
MASKLEVLNALPVFHSFLMNISTFLHLERENDFLYDDRRNLKQSALPFSI